AGRGAGRRRRALGARAGHVLVGPGDDGDRGAVRRAHRPQGHGSRRPLAHARPATGRGGATVTSGGSPSGDHRPRVLLVTGFGRSGTTLVNTILGSTPGVFAAGEVRFLWERGL